MTKVFYDKLTLGLIHGVIAHDYSLAIPKMFHTHTTSQTDTCN